MKFYPTDKMNGSNYVDQEGRMMRAVVHREYFEGSVECESNGHMFEKRTAIRSLLK